MQKKPNGRPAGTGTVWEYHQELIAVPQLLQVCQAAGQDGWELFLTLTMQLPAQPVQRINGAGLLEVVATQPAQQGLLLLFKRVAPHGSMVQRLAAAEG